MTAADSQSAAPNAMKAYQRAKARIAQAARNGSTSLSLSGLGLRSVPTEIGQLANLTQLVINNNSSRCQRVCGGVLDSSGRTEEQSQGNASLWIVSSAEQVVLTYTSFAKVERAFRSLKSIDLHQKGIHRSRIRMNSLHQRHSDEFRFG